MKFFQLPQAWNRQGFLLLELGITLGILLILITLAVPTVQLFNRQLVVTELQHIGLTMTQLQYTALTTGKQQELAIASLNPQVRFGILPNSYGPPSNPTTLLTKPITFANNKIIFYPNGTMSAGTIYCIDSQAYCMYALSADIGNYPFVRLYRYDNKTTWTLLQ